MYDDLCFLLVLLMVSWFEMLESLMIFDRGDDIDRVLASQPDGRRCLFQRGDPRWSEFQMVKMVKPPLLIIEF